MLLNDQQLLERKTQIKKVFFWRICGTGMGAAASLLKQANIEVAGCDSRFYPPMGPYLQDQGIECFGLEQITDEFLKAFDLIVVGNVVPRGGHEAKRIEALGIPYCSFPSVIGCFVLKDCNVIGIAGTHGKTTTTYFATQVFEKLGQDPGYFIGGVIPGRQSSYLGDGKYFFIESDEYDSAYFQKVSKFLSYHINSLVLTSLEFDHADIFESIDDIKKQFQMLIPNIDDQLIVCSDYQHALAITEKIKQRITYSIKESRPRIINQNKSGSTFIINYQDKELQFETNIVGDHNLLNITSIILYAFNKGFSYQDIKESVKSLEHVKRRQELRGEYDQLTVIDDFAHHPKAVSYTINAIKTQYDLPVYVVFEPASATARSAYFQGQFVDALALADSVIIIKPEKSTTAKNSSDIDVLKMQLALKKQISDVEISESLDMLQDFIKSKKRDKAVLLILSNGTCQGLWESEFVKALDK